MKIIQLAMALFCLHLLHPSMSFASNIASNVTDDYCKVLANTHWTGVGSGRGQSKCEYQGSGTIVGTTNTFQIILEATKVSGPSFCPQQINNFVLHINCLNNRIYTTEKNVNMNGLLLDPNHLTMDGQVHFKDKIENFHVYAQRG